MVAIAQEHVQSAHGGASGAEGEGNKILQPWVINGHNTHTPDNREACQSNAFYNHITPEKS